MHVRNCRSVLPSIFITSLTSGYSHFGSFKMYVMGVYISVGMFILMVSKVVGDLRL